MDDDIEDTDDNNFLLLFNRPFLETIKEFEGTSFVNLWKIAPTAIAVEDDPIFFIFLLSFIWEVGFCFGFNKRKGRIVLLCASLDNERIDGALVQNIGP